MNQPTLFITFLAILSASISAFSSYSMPHSFASGSVQAAGPACTATGTVVDTETSEPIPFAHLLVTESEVSEAGVRGATSNGSGRFSLHWKSSVDPLTISVQAVGYETKSSVELPCQSEITIHLNQKVYESGAAVVTSQSMKRKRIRNRRALFNRAARNMTAPPEEHVAYGFAKRLDVGDDPVWPVQFQYRLHVYSYGDNKPPEPSSFRFRLRLVSETDDQKPGDDLLPQPLYVEVPAENGLVTFDLTQTPPIQDPRFFVVVEWVTDNPQEASLLPFYAIKYDDGSHYGRLNPLLPWTTVRHGLIFNFEYDQ
ncbi:MAG: carboxypeptidase-like regulatory domain-containing protein [Balneolaceae bacterium]